MPKLHCLAAKINFLDCLPFKMVCVFRLCLFDAQFCYIVDVFPVPFCFCRAPKSIRNTLFTFLLPFRIVTYCAFSQSASLWHNFLCLNENAYRQLSHIHFSLTNHHEHDNFEEKLFFSHLPPVVYQSIHKIKILKYFSSFPRAKIKLRLAPGIGMQFTCPTGAKLIAGYYQSFFKQLLWGYFQL